MNRIQTVNINFWQDRELKSEPRDYLELLKLDKEADFRLNLLLCKLVGSKTIVSILIEKVKIQHNENQKSRVKTGIERAICFFRGAVGSTHWDKSDFLSCTRIISSRLMP